MIARLERWLLAGELSCYLILAVVLTIFTPATGPAMTVMFAAISVSGRAAYLVVAWYTAWRWDDADSARGAALPPAGVAAREWLALFATHSVLQPFAPLWNRILAGLPHGDRATVPPREPVVVLVHGYACNAAYWLPLRWRLQQRGVRCPPPPTLEPPFASIDDQADALARYLAGLRDRLPGHPLVLVGHSMGGLTIRACYARHGLDDVVQVITLGTPHHGSRIARLGWTRNAREMVPGSGWLRSLPSLADASSPTLVAMAARYDELVTPLVRTVPQRIEINEFINVGHLAIGWCGRTCEEIQACVDTARRAAHVRSANRITDSHSTTCTAGTSN
ncbi:lipase family alpha/beta hydrolase [Arhodomonas sp. AD133]|uniref:lipase family alpha/beta hydrolase n=1 Tax=Arhodomonas sp. AD133 TaxID=3415009 RepID=UPI003EBCC9CC